MMRKNNKEMKEYIPPTIEVTMVEIEQGIAAGSAQVTPNQQPNEQWETEDQTGTLDW
ncbi:MULTISPECIES: hypothetical protein [Elizabethkingia]|jgi:hypothetical protein|uniref:hypothetical protein n=2 Tax=Weeksellaceae TaxID=2762318 RepID=UPI0012D87B78|nr:MULTISPECIES: hypothetical protein [Elizabethkingia]MCL1657022.1 hypothetical protein [Elizabethkingia miricola]MDR2228007.1 hypothetical protein [Flavobacteriaceae bacterium]MDX8571007.1 hypothetical protein [Elizabethkingia sp. HX QKY]